MKVFVTKTFEHKELLVTGNAYYDLPDDVAAIGVGLGCAIQTQDDYTYELPKVEDEPLKKGGTELAAEYLASLPDETIYPLLGGSELALIEQRKQKAAEIEEQRVANEAYEKSKGGR